MVYGKVGLKKTQGDHNFPLKLSLAVFLISISFDVLFVFGLNFLGVVSKKTFVFVCL